MALNVSPGDHVLDLCAAPGTYFFFFNCANFLFPHSIYDYNYNVKKKSTKINCENNFFIK